MLKPWSAAFPWATLIVNVVGGLAMGALSAYGSGQSLPEWLRLGLAAGVLGGFTTFSAFSLEALSFWQKGQMGWFALHVFAHVGLSVLACAAGFYAVQRWGQ
jgi:CrcB protein